MDKQDRKDMLDVVVIAAGENFGITFNCKNGIYKAYVRNHEIVNELDEDAYSSICIVYSEWEAWEALFNYIIARTKSEMLKRLWTSMRNKLGATYVTMAKT